jgi:predicted nucleic acid-binding protein
VNRLVIDTGPLVALLNRRDTHHLWIRGLLDSVAPPLYTCEAVLSESCFLLRRLAGAEAALLTLVERNILKVDFGLGAEVAAVAALMQKFANVPMSLADACLVRMTELEPDSTIVTLDEDFRVYRRLKRQVVPVIMP